MLLPLPSRPDNDAAHGRRGDARRRARLRRPSTGFCRVAEAMLPDGLVRGGFLRGFAGPPMRCFPMGSSEAAFCGFFQCRRGGASRGARPRRLSTGFSNGGAARSAAVPFCPSLPRRLAVLLSLPSARTTMPHEHIPVHANRRAVPTLFHIFPARPSHASSFTLPPAIGCRVRTPRRCFPLGSSKAAFCGLLQGRRDDACRWARLRRLSAGFCRAAEAMLADGLVRGGLSAGFCRAAYAMLPDGLVRGGFLRAFPRSLRGSSEAAFHGIFQRRRCAQRRRSLLSFSPPPPDAARPFPPMRTGGQSLPFSTISRSPESYFFLYPAARHRMPRAHAAAMLPDGLVQGGLPRAFAGPPRRCSPKSSSEAAFCGVLQSRRGDASVGLVRGGFLRAFPTAALRAAPPFPFVLLSPAARPYFFLYHPPGQRCRTPLFLHPFVPPEGRDSAAFFAACPCGGAARSLFALSAARPALHLFFCTPPPATGCRARSPHPSRPPRQPLFPFPCFRATGAPMRTGGQPLPFPTFSRAPESCFFLYPAARPTIPRTVAEAMLAEGLVRGGLLRGFAGPPRRCFPMGSSEAASHGVFQRRRCAQRRRSLLSFSPRRPAVLLSLPSRPAIGCRTSTFPFTRTGGQSLPFSTFSYRPVVLLSLPSRPASDTARHFSCILLSRWAAGTAPLSLPPARAAE